MIEIDPEDNLFSYRLIPTERRLTFDIINQPKRVTHYGDDDGQYFKFTASNGYDMR